MKERYKGIEVEKQEMYKDYEIEELVEMYQKEPTEPLFQEILARTKNIVYKLAVTFKEVVPKADIEDLVSEGYLTLWKATQNFRIRDDIKCKFTTYLYAYLKSHYINMFHYSWRKKRNSQNEAFSLDDDKSDKDSGNRGNLNASKECEEIALAEIKLLFDELALSSRERQTVELLLDGYDKAYIAEKFGVCAPAVHSYISRVKVKLIKAGYSYRKRTA